MSKGTRAEIVIFLPRAYYPSCCLLNTYAMYVANNKMDTMRVEDQIFQSQRKV